MPESWALVRCLHSISEGTVNVSFEMIEETSICLLARPLLCSSFVLGSVRLVKPASDARKRMTM